jgi:RimJ/RimL family protein N-acetyltransferase
MRPLNPETDTPGFYQINQEPEMHTWTGNAVPKLLEEAKAELEKFATQEDVSHWTILDNKSGNITGRFFIILEDRDGLKIAGEGNRIAKPYWRKGHNKEARRFMSKYVFEELKADIYETGTWGENINSIKSIEAHGFKFSLEEERWNEKYNMNMVMRYYKMRKEDYV